MVEGKRQTEKKIMDREPYTGEVGALEHSLLVGTKPHGNSTR